MITEASTAFCAGLDLHTSNVFCGIKDSSSQPIFRRRLPNELPTILQARDPYRSQLKRRWRPVPRRVWLFITASGALQTGELSGATS